ncbi:unnamed protein product [Triticum aestivum]|uniref:Strictosidine synthase conserved region domain-containing protein n=2 Tax=Triticum aestivum TaxID=4565 RepID=A0A7H4LEG1_WHEAT|nr:protein STRICTOSIDINE SYNTHASE-LIKE 4-like [Triticum aestivum]SPT16999.1 unnamed protein product [Triticum aestivum]
MALGGLFGTAAVAVVVSLAVHVALNCPIQPVPSPPPPAARYPPNNLLQGLEKLGEGQLSAPEDVYVDAAAGGTLYTATRDGWLQRMHPNGSWEQWRFVGGTGLLGIAPSADGSVLVCDADKGLLRVEEGRVTILASTVGGSTIRFADEAIEASDGTVYFSDASTRFGFDRWFHAYVESQPTGRLLKYDPRTGKASVALDNLAFANGVALSRDEAFVIVCETGRFKCTRLWLKGDKAGQAETFVDDLPGSPDNIQLAPDGSFWVALIQRSPWLDLVMRWTFTKRVVASFPALLDAVHAAGKGAMVAQVSENGEVLRVLDDSEGKVINFITSVTEFNGDLFFGSLATNFVGKLSLAKVAQAQGQAAASS